MSQNGQAHFKNLEANGNIEKNWKPNFKKLKENVFPFARIYFQILYLSITLYKNRLSHKKWSFPLIISPVNVTKSARNCGFDHIYWKNS